MELISKTEAARIVGYHPESLMRRSRDGTFPQPIRLGDGPNARVRFIREEIDRWLADRAAARDVA